MVKSCGDNVPERPKDERETAITSLFVLHCTPDHLQGVRSELTQSGKGSDLSGLVSCFLNADRAAMSVVTPFTLQCLHDERSNSVKTAEAIEESIACLR